MSGAALHWRPSLTKVGRASLPPRCWPWSVNPCRRWRRASPLRWKARSGASPTWAATCSVPAASGCARFSPFSASRATDVPLDVAIAVGCAAELIHTATLFHDDVVDNGTVRRGRPAARMVYGNGIAVLVGDFCFARGLESVAATGSLAAVEALPQP